MKKIRFRGRVNGKWVYGYYANIHGNEEILGLDGIHYYVDNKTLGQHTGFKDKNGKEIYEGDVVKIVTNEQIGEQRIGRNTFSKYGDVESVGVVRYGKCNYPYDKVSTWHIDTEHRIEHYTSFYQDRATDKLVKIGKTIKKPIEIIKNIEVIGDVYTNQGIGDIS